jgi:uncharacterized membrane protein
MRLYELVNVVVVAVLCAASSAYAHGDRPGHIDEQGASLPTWITIVMVISWIAIALGVVFLVRRLMRTDRSKAHGGDRQKKA